MRKPTHRRPLLALSLLALLVYLAPALSAQEQPPWIFGMHDPGGEGDMAARGKQGWIVFTEEIGHNRYDWSSRDYRPWTDAGHDVAAVGETEIVEFKKVDGAAASYRPSPERLHVTDSDVSRLRVYGTTVHPTRSICETHRCNHS